MIGENHMLIRDPHPHRDMKRYILRRTNKISGHEQAIIDPELEEEEAYSIGCGKRILRKSLPNLIYGKDA
jgi:hypothetical protein